MNRSILVAAVAATGVLAAPTSALAAGESIVAGPLKVKGYDLTLTATDAGNGDSFGITAVKSSGKAMQMHSWSFASGVSVSVKGAKATIKGRLGRYGAIAATINAGGKAVGRVPAGCTGTAGIGRSGKLTGKTTLKLDTTFFKTVAPKSLKAEILSGGKLECGGGGTTPDSTGLMLTSSVETADGQMLVSILKDGGTVHQNVMRTDTASATAPASVMHMITVETAAAGLDAAGDLATATAAGAAPFLTGKLSFAGEPMGTMASGTISGDFTAKFDSIGAFTPAAGTDAMLMQR
jgi:hypothetical protein